MENLLDIENLQLKFYTYEGVVEALDGVNLSLKRGETLGLVGETGCGKSVTGLSVLVLVPPPGRIEGGRVFLNTQKKRMDMLSQDDAFLRNIRGNDISIVFQEPRSALNPVYTVTDQISEVLLHHMGEELVRRAFCELENDIKKIDELTRAKKVKGIRKLIYRIRRFNYNFQKNIYGKMLKNPNSISLKFFSRIPIVRRYKNRLKSECKKEVVQILKEMEIPDPSRVADMYPFELSGGMAQRVVIAMALACNPTLLIADEPTTNLDVTVQAQILDLIRRLKERFKSSILYVTHDLGVVAELCDRVAVMYAGNVVELADVMEIFKDPLHPYARALLESIPRPGKEFKSIEGVVPSLINPPIGCRFHDRCLYAMEVCTRVKPVWMEVKTNHFVACHLYAEGAK